MDNKNIIKKPTAGGINTASGSKGKEVINYTKELSKLIKINEKSVINFEGETSEKNLRDTLYPNNTAGGKNSNVLFRMTEQERQELAEIFKGVDREIFNTLNDRV